jgi:N-acetylmuramoyl-L-alanine amidase
MGQHTVQQGECISSLAQENGLFWETIWNHPENTSLKQLRQDPNVLFPGDVVFIPEKTIKEESRSTDSIHCFKRKGVPAKFKVRLAINDQPLAGKNCRICIDDRWEEGKTDSNGFVTGTIPPNAQRGKIMVQNGNSQLIFEFQFGTVDPIETEEGIRGRLMNMGYSAQTDLPSSIRAFQEKEGLTVTGELDETTRSRIKEKFGQ